MASRISFLYLLILFAATLPMSAWAWSGEVVGIEDGDIIIVYHSRTLKEVKTRLYGIETPERGQAIDKKARQLSEVPDIPAVKRIIKQGIEEKILRYGFFSENREISRISIAIPYGASEIIMYALKKKIIDSAVVVCDGAGSVITDNPEIV